MNILQISTYYPPHFGGIEQLAYDFSRILTSYGHNVEVICFNSEHKDSCDVVEGVKVHRVGYKLKIASQAISLNYFFTLKRVIRDFKPDAIHVHMPNPLITVYLLMINPKCRITLHWHSDIIKQEKIHTLYAPFERKIINKAWKIAATTEIYAASSVYIQGMTDKVSVIPCIIEGSTFDNTGASQAEIEQSIKKQFNGKKIIFTCGVHRLYKGLTYLVKAAQYLPSEYAVVIAGIGPLSDSLKEETQRLGLNNVYFPGRISNEEKCAYLHCADVFAFPSITKNEAFGIALCEALYCGVPAVTFTIPGSGVNYVNQDGVTGLEVKEHDPKLYAEALLKASANRKHYSQVAHKWAKEHFTEEAIKEKVNNFFTK